MFGIGIMEIIVVAVAVLLFVGPRRLPQTMRQFGRFFVRVRRMSTEAKETFDRVIQEAERELDAEADLKEIKRNIALPGKGSKLSVGSISRDNDGDAKGC